MNDVVKSGAVILTESGKKICFPMCWVCRREVSSFHEDDASDHCPRGSIRFFVLCHGQREEVILTYAELEEMSNLSVSWAFRPREKLEDPRVLPAPASKKLLP